MNETEKARFVNLIRGVGYLDKLSFHDLANISNELIDLIDLCGCREHNYSSDLIVHNCKLFGPRINAHRETEHSQSCSCCQTQIFLYYFGRCMAKLSAEGKLPQFLDNGLTYAKIRDRTYGHVHNGSKITFEIFRHHNAWRSPANMEVINQKWEFDFNNLSLNEV